MSEYLFPPAGHVWEGAAPYGVAGALTHGTRVDADASRVARGEVFGDPGAPLAGTADLQPPPVTGAAAGAAAAVVSLLGVSGGAVVGLVSRADIRADRLPDGHDGLRPGVVVTRMGGGPSGDFDGDEATLSLRVYGDGTRSGVNAVVSAVIGQLHRVSNLDTGAGRIISCVVVGVSDTVDGDMDDGAVPVCVVLVEVVIG